MTSRERTSYFPREEKIDRKLRKKTLGDWCLILLFGAINWPWLLVSLYGGSETSRQILLKKLKLSEDALPHLGSWKADIGLLRVISEYISEYRPQTVVEFGTGASTLIAAQSLKLAGGGRLISFDAHKEFITATRQWLRENDLEVEVRHAPLTKLVNGWGKRWYDFYSLPEQIDLLLLDGPPWAIHPFIRGAAEMLFDRLTVGGFIILDDGARPSERFIAGAWKRRWPNIEFQLHRAGSKGVLIGRRKY